MSEQYNSIHSCSDASAQLTVLFITFLKKAIPIQLLNEKNLLDIIQITYFNKKYWSPIYFLILVNAGGTLMQGGTQHLMIYN